VTRERDGSHDVKHRSSGLRPSAARCARTPDAEDATQEVFLHVFLKLPTFRGGPRTARCGT
jgi:DNA-directed RNA polymerase specialized sigma24 family protein